MSLLLGEFVQTNNLQHMLTERIRGRNTIPKITIELGVECWKLRTPCLLHYWYHDLDGSQFTVARIIYMIIDVVRCRGSL